MYPAFQKLNFTYFKIPIHDETYFRREQGPLR